MRYGTAMPNDDLPDAQPGRQLAAMRKRVGVKQQDLAAELGIHRTRLNAWESAEPLDALRAIRYQQALRRLAERAVASGEEVA